jgi:hypothetical protein
MVTAVRSETQQTIIVPRRWLLLVQVRNMLSRTTDIGECTLEKIDRGIRNQWIETIGVYGFDGRDRCHVGLELEIDWDAYSVQVALLGETVSVKKIVLTEENLVPEVRNVVKVFTQAVIEARLRTKWIVYYPKDLDGERINRELGFKRPSPLTWAGKIRQQTFEVEEFPELTVTFSEAVPEVGSHPDG